MSRALALATWPRGNMSRALALAHVAAVLLMHVPPVGASVEVCPAATNPPILSSESWPCPAGYEVHAHSPLQCRPCTRGTAMPDWLGVYKTVSACVLTFDGDKCEAGQRCSESADCASGLVCTADSRVRNEAWYTAPPQGDFCFPHMCQPCAAGKYQCQYAQVACDSCSAGFFQDQAGLACKRCPAGKYAGAAALDSCSVCDAGKFSRALQPDDGVTHTSCSSCVAGRYSDQVRQASCKVCGVGQSQSRTGEVGCAPCLRGRYNDQQGQTLCAVCAMGQYADQAGQEQCKGCSTSAGSCQQCNRGEWALPQTSDGPSACTNCPAGKYSDQKGQQSCKLCGAGKQSELEGQTKASKCTDCTTGLYAYSPGSATCPPCPIGKFTNGGGNPCIICKKGQAVDRTGGVAVTSGAAKCEPCPAGQHVQSLSQPYSEGTYTYTACRLCEAGSFASAESEVPSGGCGVCGTGRYQYDRGSSSCHECLAPFGRTTNKTSGARMETGATWCTHEVLTATCVATGGEFRLTLLSSQSTAIPWNAAPIAVATALSALTLGTVDVIFSTGTTACAAHPGVIISIIIPSTSPFTAAAVLASLTSADSSKLAGEVASITAETVQDGNAVQKVKEVQKVTCVAGKGSFAIKFGTWTSRSIPWADGPEGIKAALEAQSSPMGTVTVQFSSFGGHACSAYPGTDINITFESGVGDVTTQIVPDIGTLGFGEAITLAAATVPALAATDPSAPTPAPSGAPTAECSPGKYWKVDAANAGCSGCPVGRYNGAPVQVTAGLAACKFCPVGREARAPNATGCTTCLSGYFRSFSENADLCAACPAGTFSKPGDSPCEAAPLDSLAWLSLAERSAQSSADTANLRPGCSPRQCSVCGTAGGMDAAAFAAVPGSASCTQCNYGKFALPAVGKPTLGATHCGELYALSEHPNSANTTEPFGTLRLAADPNGGGMQCPSVDARLRKECAGDTEFWQEICAGKGCCFDPSSASGIKCYNAVPASSSPLLPPVFSEDAQDADYSMVQDGHALASVLPFVPGDELRLAGTNASFEWVVPTTDTLWAWLRWQAELREDDLSLALGDAEMLVAANTNETLLTRGPAAVKAALLAALHSRRHDANSHNHHDQHRRRLAAAESQLPTQACKVPCQDSSPALAADCAMYAKHQLADTDDNLRTLAENVAEVRAAGLNLGAGTTVCDLARLDALAQKPAAAASWARETVYNSTRRRRVHTQDAAMHCRRSCVPELCTKTVPNVQVQAPQAENSAQAIASLALAASKIGAERKQASQVPWTARLDALHVYAEQLARCAAVEDEYRETLRSEDLLANMDKNLISDACKGDCFSAGDSQCLPSKAFTRRLLTLGAWADDAALRQSGHSPRAGRPPAIVSRRVECNATAEPAFVDGNARRNCWVVVSLVGSEARDSSFTMASVNGNRTDATFERSQRQPANMDYPAVVRILFRVRQPGIHRVSLHFALGPSPTQSCRDAGHVPGCFLSTVVSTFVAVGGLHVPLRECATGKAAVPQWSPAQLLRQISAGRDDNVRMRGAGHYDGDLERERYIDLFVDVNVVNEQGKTFAKFPSEGAKWAEVAGAAANSLTSIVDHGALLRTQLVVPGSRRRRRAQPFAFYPAAQDLQYHENSTLALFAEAHGECANEYDQCGGAGFNGPTCCKSGCTCKAKDAYYSQCMPANGLSVCEVRGNLCAAIANEAGYTASYSRLSHVRVMREPSWPCDLSAQFGAEDSVSFSVSQRKWFTGDQLQFGGDTDDCRVIAHTSDGAINGTHRVECRSIRSVARVSELLRDIRWTTSREGEFLHHNTGERHFFVALWRGAGPAFEDNIYANVTLKLTRKGAPARVQLLAEGDGINGLEPVSNNIPVVVFRPVPRLHVRVVSNDNQTLNAHASSIVGTATLVIRQSQADGGAVVRSAELPLTGIGHRNVTGAVFDGVESFDVVGRYVVLVRVQLTSSRVANFSVDSVGSFVVECSECPPGYTCPRDAAGKKMSIEPCPPSQFCVSGLQQECPIGYFCPGQAAKGEPGTSEPLPCGDPAFYCPARSAKRTPVVPGQYSCNKDASSVGSCTVDPLRVSLRSGVETCRAGQFCARGGRALNCTPGTSSPQPGSISCTECVAGRYARVPGRRLCDKCPEGHYCPAGCKVPIPCRGSRSVFCPSGAKEPQQVRAGYYAPEENAVGCFHNMSTECYSVPVHVREQRCGVGFYCSYGARRAIKDGTLGTGEGSDETNRSSVVPCGAGDICKRGTRHACPVGFECDGVAATVCAAKNGTYSTVDGRCAPCGQNSFVRWREAAELEPMWTSGSDESAGAASAGVARLSSTTAIGVNCTACPPPPGVECKAGVVVVLPGYWYDSWDDPSAITSETRFYRCVHADTCLLNATTNGVRCRDGYTGRLCSSCADGFGKLGTRCVPCGSPWMQIVAILLCGTLLVVLLLVLVKKSLKTKVSERSTMAALKILITYLWSTGLLASFQLDWGATLKTLFSVSAAGGGADFVQFSSCAVVLSFVELNVLYLSLPLLVVVMPGALIAACYAWRLWRSKRGRQADIRVWGVKPFHLFRSSSLMFLYVTWPLITVRCLQLLHRIDIDGVQYVSSDLSVRASGPEYEALAIAAIFEIVFVVVGFPFTIGMLLWRSRHTRHEDDVRERYLFLYGGYKSKYYMWELVVMARKFLFVTAATLLQGNQVGMQVYCGLWVVLVSFCLHITCQPYTNRAETIMETVALGAVSVSLLLGQGIALQGTPPHWGAENTRAVQALVGVLNVLVVLFFGRVFCSELLMQLSESFEAGVGEKDGATRMLLRRFIMCLSGACCLQTKLFGTGAALDEPLNPIIVGKRSGGRLSKHGVPASGSSNWSAGDEAAEVLHIETRQTVSLSIDNALQAMQPRSPPRSPRPQAAPALPESDSWIQLKDTEGVPYYFNTATNSTSRRLPGGDASRSASSNGQSFVALDRHESATFMAQHAANRRARAMGVRRLGGGPVPRGARSAGRTGSDRGVVRLTTAFGNFSAKSRSLFGMRNPLNVNRLSDRSAGPGKVLGPGTGADAAGAGATGPQQLQGAAASAMSVHHLDRTNMNMPSSAKSVRL